jgi:1-acyl-sn-glycerol-3-phosphate acyltransferase
VNFNFIKNFACSIFLSNQLSIIQYGEIMKQAFIPPKISSFWYWLARKIPFVVFKILENITEIHIRDEDLQILKNHKKDRLLFFTNHPTTAEPPLVVYTANLIKEKFHFIASRQIFEWGGGALGYILPYFGAYSVIAGIPDKASVKMTRKILSAKGGKLVIFPEGEPTSGENDSLMPFQPGIGMLGFWALEDARKDDKDADITVIPSFWRFVIKASPNKIKQVVDKKLKKMEKKLGIEPGSKTSVERFMTIGRVMIEQYEKRLGIVPDNPEDFNYRVGRIRHALLNEVADIYNATGYKHEHNAILKFRALFSIAELLLINYKNPKLPKLSKKVKKQAFLDLVHSFDFIIIKRDHLEEKPTPERMFEWLDRYETLVLGKKPRALGGRPSPLPKKAYLYFGKPFKLSEFYRKDKKEKRRAVQNITEKLKDDLQTLLEESASLNKVLEL